MGEITAGAVHPAAGRDEFHGSDKMHDRRTAHRIAETDKPAEAASLAEFAHDLCSPLNALAIAARCLRDEGTSDDRSGNIDTIIRISEHALGMLQGALDQARIEPGRDAPQRETCDLELLVGYVNDVCRPFAQAKKLEFIIHRDPACPRYVRTDTSLLQRILVNVLDNAVKYTAQGSVTLSLDWRDSRDAEQPWLIFEIQDTGMGIARADQTRVFERFVRGSGAAATNGSGLGLAIASKLARLMGGSIRVQSKPGTGSSFRIELPVARASETDGALPPTLQPKPPLPLEDLAALPYELRAELRESLLALDVPRIHKAIERIAEHDAALGEILQSHASGFAFSGIFEAVSLGL